LYGDGVFRRSLDAPMKNGHPKGLPVVSVINLRDCPWRFDHEPAPRCPVGGCAAAQGQWAQHFPELPSCRDPFAWEGHPSRLAFTTDLHLRRPPCPQQQHGRALSPQHSSDYAVRPSSYHATTHPKS